MQATASDQGYNSGKKCEKERVRLVGCRSGRMRWNELYQIAPYPTHQVTLDSLIFYIICKTWHKEAQHTEIQYRDVIYKTWQLFGSGFVASAVELYSTSVFETLHDCQDENFFQQVSVCILNDRTCSTLSAIQAAGV